MPETLTKQQKLELRGVWGGTCNRLDCLTLNPTWLDQQDSSYVCVACAVMLNAGKPSGRCVSMDQHDRACSVFRAGRCDCVALIPASTPSEGIEP